MLLHRLQPIAVTRAATRSHHFASARLLAPSLATRGATRKDPNPARSRFLRAARAGPHMGHRNGPREAIGGHLRALALQVAGAR